jgi:hypothetical protein
VGIGFKTADQIAQRLGIPHNSRRPRIPSLARVAHSHDATPRPRTVMRDLEPRAKAVAEVTALLDGAAWRG